MHTHLRAIIYTWASPFAVMFLKGENPPDTHVDTRTCVSPHRPLSLNELITEKNVRHECGMSTCL